MRFFPDGYANGWTTLRATAYVHSVPARASGPQADLEQLFGFYAARQQKLLKRLEQSPATIYELLNAVFARLDVSRMFLMLSEVLANIEVLELPIDSALAMIADGRIVDAKTIMLLQYAALHIFR